MRERKKQIWLRSDQVELTVSCLNFIRARLNDDLAMANGAHKVVAGQFTYKRIAEIVELLGGKVTP